MSNGGKTSNSSKVGHKKKTPPKFGTSAEYVVDSDSDSDVEIENKKLQEPDRTGPTDISKSKAAKNLKRKAADISRTSQNHNSLGAESKDSRKSVNEQSTEGLQSNNRSQGNSKRSRAGTSDSSGSSSSEDAFSEENSTLGGTTNTSAQQRHTKSKKVDLDSDISSTSEHESEDKSSGGEESKDESEAEDQNHGESTNSTIAAAQTSITDATPPFRPPDGFSTSSMDKDQTTRMRNVFSKEALQGKEIWHLTVPASVSIEDVKALALADILDGKPILTHRDIDYGFSAEAREGTTAKVLVPARDGRIYQPVTTNVHRTLHLRQIVHIPNTSSAHSIGTPGTISGARKPTLKQPQGLKLGYLPFGDTETDVDDRTAVKQAKQRIDNTKIPVFEHPSPTGKKTKRSKMSATEVEKPTEWVDPEAYSAPLVVGSASQHTIEFPSQITSDVAASSQQESQLSYIETDASEEKARRKAEKVARREARQARKEAKLSKT